MPLLDRSAAMAAFKAALFVAIASAKLKNFPSYCSVFWSLIYSVFLLVTHLTLFALNLRPSDKPLPLPADGCRLAGSFQGAVSQPVPTR